MNDRNRSRSRKSSAADTSDEAPVVVEEDQTPVQPDEPAVEGAPVTEDNEASNDESTSVHSEDQKPDDSDVPLRKGKGGTYTMVGGKRVRVPASE